MSHTDFPIERLALRSDGQVLASASHDQTVKLWDLAADEDEDEESASPRSMAEEEGSEGAQQAAEGGACPEAEALRLGVSSGAEGDEDPSEGEGEDSDSRGSSSSDEEDARERKRRRGKGAHRIPSKNVENKQSGGAFFADL